MKRVVPGIVILLWIVCSAPRHATAQGDAAVSGTVRDLHGTPQMGALVELLGPDASVVTRTFTDDHGRYVLETKLSGRYGLRASAAFLLPAWRSELRLYVGTRAIANLTMTAMDEVGVWFPAEKRSLAEPADDWRWTLRSSANRPLLRLANQTDSAVSSSAHSAEVQGAAAAQERFAVTSGDGRFAEGGTHQVFSVNRAEFGGRTEMLRASLGDPELGGGVAPSVTVNAGYERQTHTGGEVRFVAGYASHPEVLGPNATGLQTVTLASSERIALGDAVMIDAGTLLSAERLVSSRVSANPFLRLVVSPASNLALMYRYATGLSLQSSDDLDEEAMPTVLSDAKGRPLTLAGAHHELAVAHKTDTDTETLAVYEDRMPFAAVQGNGELNAKEIQGLPIVADAGTATFRAAVHGYAAQGISVSWTHTVAPAVQACVQGDLGTTLSLQDHSPTLNNLGSALRPHMKPALSATVHGTVARTGTSFRAQYRWQPRGTVTAVNAFNTAQGEAYLSASLRQRLWSGRRLQGLDAVIEASNLLEEGYEPLLGPDGETLFLAQVPRSVQGGLSFRF